METSRQSRGTAVWVLPLDSSGCGACTQQIYALLSPQYAAQMRAKGVSLARGPRHADVVLITGALSEKARAPIERVLGGVPQPRALVAVGNCAIDGCVFRGSPHLIANAAETLDVNVEIAGCPPAPQAILDAITQAAQLLYSEPDTDETEDEGAGEVEAADQEMTEAPAEVEETSKAQVEVAEDANADTQDASEVEIAPLIEAAAEDQSMEDAATQKSTAGRSKGTSNCGKTNSDRDTDTSNHSKSTSARGRATSDGPRASRSTSKRRGGSR